MRTFNDNLEEKRLRAKLPKDLISYLDQSPDKAGEIALKKWDELGPVNIRSIEKFSNLPDIEMDKKFG